MFSSTNSIFDLHSLDILEYVSIENENNNFNNNIQENQIGLLSNNIRNNNSNSSNLRLAKKIKIKAFLAWIPWRPPRLRRSDQRAGHEAGCPVGRNRRPAGDHRRQTAVAEAAPEGHG